MKLEDVLLVADEKQVRVGQPCVKGASVQGEIIEQGKGEKLIIFKKIRRQKKSLKKGHRQPLTRIRVKEISAS